MTRAYSRRALKTKKTQTPDQTSTALVQATGGKLLWIEPMVVDMASRVVTPKATLAGTALWSNQKDIHDTETVIVQGT